MGNVMSVDKRTGMISSGGLVLGATDDFARKIGGQSLAQEVSTPGDFRALVTASLGESNGFSR
jgi:hypothetical protein